MHESDSLCRQESEPTKMFIITSFSEELTQRENFSRSGNVTKICFVEIKRLELLLDVLLDGDGDELRDFILNGREMEDLEEK